MRSLAIFAGLLFAAPAYAGGVGLMATGGIHEGSAYYYSANGVQGIDTQNRPNTGFGAEILLGDKDDRINGLMRAYINMDWPLNEPTTVGITLEEATYPAAHLEPVRADGVITMGIQWGLFGDPTGLQLIGTTMFGSAFATPDNLEYFIAELGVGGTYTLNDQLQLTGSIVGATRYRKQLSLSEGVFVGVRYLFD